VRYIDIGDQEPDAKWIARADRVLAELQAASDEHEKAKIIDRNGALWSELKDWLLELSHGKCWFSEAKDCFSYLHVEHFRPKKSAKDKDGTSHSGYWWLALDWQNFRVCGSVGNTKKGTYFPLQTGCNRAHGPGADLRLEVPLLLDPADPHDPTLLTFDVEGHARPAAHLGEGWERERADYSIERLTLDFPPLMDKRKLLWAECWRRVKAYLSELARADADPTNAVARIQARAAALEIRKMINPSAELSATARACMVGTGDPRVTALL
jgi:uncharacterized protein (TIGR02646 family)